MKIINAQEWLDQKVNQIPNKDVIKVLGRKQAGVKDEEYLKLEEDEFLKGELKIDGFPNLQIINFGGEFKRNVKGFLTKVTITNCPRVRSVDLNRNEISELDVSGLNNLTNLYANYNKLEKINVEGC